MMRVCQEPRSLINPILCICDSFLKEEEWGNRFLHCKENNEMSLSRPMLGSHTALWPEVFTFFSHLSCHLVHLVLYKWKTKEGKTYGSYSLISMSQRKVTCLHFFLREAKVGILENEKDHVQYEKLAAGPKFWSLWLTRMLNKRASELPLLPHFLAIAFPPVLFPQMLFPLPCTTVSTARRATGLKGHEEFWKLAGSVSLFHGILIFPAGNSISLC